MTVHILKLAAAQRQLDAAIRMMFGEEDILAVTTVANAAHKILCTLKEKDGQDVLADQLCDGILGLARALVRGELSEDEIERFKKSALWEPIETAAQAIRSHGADTRMVDLKSILRVEIPHAVKNEYWNKMRAPANFLKHAGKDHQSYLSEDEVNADELIFGACNVYLDITGGATPEMKVWIAASLVRMNVSVPPRPNPLAPIAELLRKVAPEDRNTVCRELILELKQKPKLKP